jgi:hypothetical protein
MAVTATPTAIRPNLHVSLQHNRHAPCQTPWPRFVWTIDEAAEITEFVITVLKLGPLSPVPIGSYTITDGTARTYQPTLEETIPELLPPPENTGTNYYYTWTIKATAVGKDESSSSNEGFFYVSNFHTLGVNQNTTNGVVPNKGIRKFKSKITMKRLATRDD